MTIRENLRPVMRPNVLARGAALTVILVGCSALFGWVFDIAVLKSVIPGLATMKVNTALAFVFTGLSLWLIQTPQIRPSHFIAKGCASLVTLVALLTLTEYLAGYDFGIDQILAMDPATQPAAHPGRMSLATAANFLVLGAALLLLDVEVGHGNFPSQWLSLFAGFTSLVALIGYAYDVEALYSIRPYASVALHTATAFFLLSLGVLCARANRGMMSLIGDLRFGLAPQVITLVVAAVILVGGLISAVMVRQSKSALREQIATNNLANAELVAEFAWRYVQGAQLSIEFLAKSPNVVDAAASGNFAEATTTLQEFRKLNSWLNGCGLYDINGFNRATSNDPSTANIGGNSRDREWFQQAVSTAMPYLGLPVITRSTKRPVLPYAVPVRDQKGAMIAILTGGIALDALADSITKFQSGPQSRASLTDWRQGGVVLAHHDRERILKPTSEKNDVARRMQNGERGSLESTNDVGEVHLVSFAPVPNLPWGVMILQSRQATFATIAVSARRTLSLIGILLLCAAVAAGLLARRVTRPLSQLLEAAKRVAAGELNTRLNFTRQDELGDLGRTFDHMSVVLSERTALLQQVNDVLHEQNREIQQANRLKSEFLANMSHELRTPLNAIIGFAQLMHDGKVGPIAANHQEFLGDILGSGRHLLQLINDVLDLAKVESGKMEFSPEPVSLTKIIREVVQVLQSLSASKQLAVQVEASPAVDQATIDPAKFKQVLYNYLSNAIKFTPEKGQITIRVLAEGADSFRLEVQDTGIGIAPEQIDKLFAEFYQLDATTAKKHQGTGLGLVLTKKMVEAQGGRVGVQSIVGQGSVFYAVLPKLAAHKSDTRAQWHTSAAAIVSDSPSVLIVEDNETDLQWIAKTLLARGHRFDTARTGAEALAKSKATVYSVILLDLILPDMIGWDVLHAIRMEGANQHTAVIVVTVVAEKEMAKGFPVQDYLTKPLAPETLIASLKSAGVQGNGDRKKILVVDDDPNALKLARAALQSSRYEAVCHASSRDGLAAVAQSRFDAIVLDLLMPEIDGFEFLDRFRAMSECRDTPVIVWTNKDLSAQERERLHRSAQSIALKGPDGIDVVLVELQRRVASRGAILPIERAL